MRIEFEVPVETLEAMLGSVRIPEVFRVHQVIRTPPEIGDIHAAVAAELQSIGAPRMFRPEQRVAIGVGSRGIRGLSETVAALVSELRSWGTEPFIIPAMGSHGGATGPGQLDVLAHLGVTPDAVGAPVLSEMDTVVVGSTKSGLPVHLDRLAAAADAIIVVNRVKPHTAFRGPYESGLAKMVAIGLGKQAGAAATHARGFGDMARMVPEMAEVALNRAPIRFGLAILENAHDEPFKVVALPADRILAEEPPLLLEARAAMPRIPFEVFDILVIDTIGKNISGDGADPNITGRYPTAFASGGPTVNKQVVLDLAEASAGNANGLGTADFTTVRAARKMSLAQTYPNALTSTVPGPVALPMVLPSDRLAIAAAVLTCNAVHRPPRLIRIESTLRLDSFWISDGLLPDARRQERVQLVSGRQEMDFDTEGNLQDLAAPTFAGSASAASLTDSW